VDEYRGRWAIRSGEEEVIVVHLHHSAWECFVEPWEMIPAVAAMSRKERMGRKE
jgi:hypothetical protein